MTHALFAAVEIAIGATLSAIVASLVVQFAFWVFDRKRPAQPKKFDIYTASFFDKKIAIELRSDVYAERLAAARCYFHARRNWSIDA